MEACAAILAMFINTYEVSDSLTIETKIEKVYAWVEVVHEKLGQRSLLITTELKQDEYWRYKEECVDGRTVYHVFRERSK